METHLSAGACLTRDSLLAVTKGHRNTQPIRCTPGINMLADWHAAAAHVA
jgi:hypothetical protein